jgi:threonine dehydratase
MTEALFQAIQEAHQALRPQVLTTPLEYSVLLSEELGSELYFKCEHNQRTGSFKYRGASNKIRLLSDAVARQGVITASTGNHGQGLALAGRGRQVPVTVYAPAFASPAKLKKIELYGASIELVEGDALESELAAGAAARERGVTFVSPYNDLDIIAGQGTVGMEIAEQLPEADAVFIAVGGGGLLSGTASALKQLQPQTEIVACWPQVAHSMHACLQAGKIVDIEESETLSDGTAGGVEPGSVTFELCQQLIDRQVLVSEAAIAEAMREMARKEQWMVEGAAGVALAAMQQCRADYVGKKVVVVLCGRNITLEKYLKVLNGDHAG